MNIRAKRSYTKLINRLSKTLNSTLKTFTLGHIKSSDNKYPFHKIILGDHNQRRALISAGIHRDEPAGMEQYALF